MSWRATSHRVLVWTGGGALLLAMSVDALAVIGRHAGVPLLGSIEIVQVAVLLAGVAAMLVATLARVHATVHLLAERVPGHGRDVLQRFSLFCAALFFAALLAGSLWIAADLWHAQEESELLRLPYRPLRILTIAAALLVTLVFLRQAFARQPR